MPRAPSILQRIGPLVLALLVSSGCVAPPPRVTPAELGIPSVQVASRDVDAWIDHVAPPADRVGRLPWFPDVASGMVAADRTDRPLLVWIGIQHPLGCSCPGELLGEKESLLDPSIASLLAEFTLAADSREAVENGVGPALSRFHESCAQPDGKYVGKVASGFYAVTPSGLLLARSNTFYLDELTLAVTTALERWFELDPSERHIDSESELGQLLARAVPSGFTAVSSTARPLPASDSPQGNRYPAIDRAESWVTTQSLEALLPPSPISGVQSDASDLARQLASTTFVDPSQPAPFLASDVIAAQLHSTVEAIDDASIRVRLSGETWTYSETTGRGILTELGGFALFDAKKYRIKSLTLFAKGRARSERGLTSNGWVVGLAPVWHLGAVEPRFVAE